MKKYSLLAALAAAAASFFMLTGFDSAVSSDELLRQAAQSLKTTEHVIVSPSLDLGFSIVLPSADGKSEATEAPVAISADGELQLDRSSGFAVHADGSADINLLNMILPYKGDSYIVPDDTADLLLFAGYDEGRGMNWQVLPAELPGSLLAKLRGDEAFVLDTFPIDFEVAPEPVEVNGVSCYALRTQIGWQGLKDLFYDAAAKAGDGQSQLPQLPQQAEVLANQAFAGILLDVELDISEDTYLAQSFSIKANESSDWTAIASIVASYLSVGGNTVDISVKDSVFDIEVAFDYETPVSVDVPDEVVTAITAPANE